MDETKVFSDGGCIGNPGPGGWAAIVFREGRYREFGGGETHTTNNRMEMTGAIEGLTRVGEGERVRVITDSRYLIDGASKWIRGWKKRGWKKADGDEVLNRDLWEAIDELSRTRKVSWTHVKGHAGHPENERCDKIANGFARGEAVELKSGDGEWIFKDAKPSQKPRAAKAKPQPQLEFEPGEKYPSPIYLSVVDGDVREHATWTECEARIKGIKGSRCKKVSSKGEHIATLASWGDLV